MIVIEINEWKYSLLLRRFFCIIEVEERCKYIKNRIAWLTRIMFLKGGLIKEKRG